MRHTPDHMRPEVSVVVPMHNELDNLPSTIDRIAAALSESGRTFEIVAVDDGSTDATSDRLQSMAQSNPYLQVVSYHKNRGRGYAIRKGFEAARGAIMATIDADLSYDPRHIVEMLDILAERPEIDFVVGSPYTQGGRTIDVPAGRLWISRWGNRILGLAMPGGLTTVTGILRAYRREVLEVLDLESNDKDLHLEIVSKALAAGFVPAEMPATLTGRRRGKSKFFFKATVASHLIFSFYEKPILLFGLIGALIMGLGIGAGLHLVYLWQTESLNPDRPLVSLTVILMVAGLQVVLFGFLGSQIVQVRRELFRTQKTVKSAMNAIARHDRSTTADTTPQPQRPKPASERETVAR